MAAESESSLPFERRASTLEVAKFFLRLGTTTFGGPPVHIAIMEDEVVSRRRWMTRARFLDLLGATNLIPGPNSTELAIYIGHHEAGWPGLLVAGACFILPAAAITLVLAWAYVQYGTRPAAGAALYGLKPVIIALIAQVLWNLGRTALKSLRRGTLAALAVAAQLYGANAVAVLLVCGAAAMIWHELADGRFRAHAPTAWLGATSAITSGAMATTAALPFSLTALFLFFLKVGATLFGSGYVLLAFLRGDLVEHWHWLTDRQLLDAIAIGQITPGPIFSTATFIGYLLAGLPGAVIATVGIFLPSFAFVAVSGPLIPHIRRSPMAGAFLDGVIVGSLALLAVVAVSLTTAAIVDMPTLLIFVASAILLLRYRLNSIWLLAGGILVGLALGTA